MVTAFSVATGSEALLDKHFTVASGDHGLSQASQESLALGRPIEVSASLRFSTSLWSLSTLGQWMGGGCTSCHFPSWGTKRQASVV